MKKHGVSFGDAARVLADKEGDVCHVEEYDEDHSDDEERYVTTASHPDARDLVLRICWTERKSSKGQLLTWIISARTASKKETRDYGKEIRGEKRNN